MLENTHIMRSFLTLIFLLITSHWILANTEEPRSLVVEAEASAFGKHLATMSPEKRADAIIVWWDHNEAQFNPSPQAKAIRFYKEIIDCKELAIPALKSAMSNSNPEVRVGASAALDALGPLALPALNELKKGIEDPDWQVREYATLAVSDFGCLATPAIPSMIKNLGHNSALLRGRTVCALGYLGEVARPAVPHLVEMLRHPETFEAGWKPEIAVQAISRILWQQFTSPKEVMDWWEKTGKNLHFSNEAKD
jgi:HEAT repeat protein